uniref:Nudix hydrolase domain-containing protein n=1 Tax=Amphora coffeiformis TaxID=265554 RepID=A0A7S3P4I3_9STRA
MSTLSFPFRGRQVPVTVASSVPAEHAVAALQSQPFQTWYQRCEQSGSSSDKHLEIHSVEIQSVDMFGARKVGFIKIKSDCTLTDTSGETVRLPGICFLRGNAVTILVALFCQDEQYALLVEQPRVPIGQVSCLELPAGMMDDDTQSVTGIAVQEIREECGIEIEASSLVDLSDLALQAPVRQGHLPMAAIPHSPGGCDEFCRYLYTEKRVTNAELEAMRGRLQGLRDHGEHIVLRVVTMDEVWSLSGDAKAMIALFLSQQLRKQGRLASPGGLATPLTPEPKLTLNNGIKIPQLAFGLYKVPDTVEGEAIILNAIRAGYRHFDGAAFYKNEQTLGRALRQSGLPRKAFLSPAKCGMMLSRAVVMLSRLVSRKL